MNNKEIIKTGFRDLDNVISGFKNGELIVIGARPGIGKTSFGISLINNIAVNNKIPIGVFTLECSTETYMNKLLQNVRVNKKRSENLYKDQLKSISDGASKLYESPLHIDDTPNIEIDDLCKKTRKMKHNHSIHILLIDYLGLIQESDEKTSRDKEMDKIIIRLKQLALELNIPIVVFSQVGRSAEATEPSLESFRESSQVSLSPDLIMFLHRLRFFGGNDHTDTVKLIIAKESQGMVGDLFLNFNLERSKFEDIEQTEEIKQKFNNDIECHNKQKEEKDRIQTIEKEFWQYFITKNKNIINVNNMSFTDRGLKIGLGMFHRLIFVSHSDGSLILFQVSRFCPLEQNIFLYKEIIGRYLGDNFRLLRPMGRFIQIENYDLSFTDNSHWDELSEFFIKNAEQCIKLYQNEIEPQLNHNVQK